MVVDLHQVNNRDPFIYKTADFGRTFRAITSGIRKSMLSCARAICEDPVRRGLLYAGTENAICVPFDDGENWQPLQTNLPAAQKTWSRPSASAAVTAPFGSALSNGHCWHTARAPCARTARRGPAHTVRIENGRSPRQVAAAQERPEFLLDETVGGRSTPRPGVDDVSRLWRRLFRVARRPVSR